MDVAGGHGCPGKLGRVERLGVASVVLVEVCQAVIEEDWRRHVRWDREGDGAARGCYGSRANERIVRSIGNIDGFPRPLRGVVLCVVLIVEVRCD